MLKFQYSYFIFAVLIFFLELYIALYVHDEIIRPHIGDLLVVILIYCFLKSFLNLSVLIIAIATLLFSYIIEVLQYFNIVKKLGLQNSKLARIIIGTDFSWIDMLSYTMGIALVLLIEKILNGKNNIIQKENSPLRRYRTTAALAIAVGDARIVGCSSLSAIVPDER